MSDWYVVPSTSGAQDFEPEVAPFADGDLRVDRWNVSLTAPRFTLTILGPDDAA